MKYYKSFFPSKYFNFESKYFSFDIPVLLFPHEKQPKPKQNKENVKCFDLLCLQVVENPVPVLAMYPKALP